MAPPHADDADPVVRKAQLTGGSTVTVSLPKEWADRQGLDAGTELWLYALEDRVVVAPTATATDRQTVTVDVDGLDEDALARLLRAAYTAGSDSIAVTADGGLTDDQRRLAGRTLSGFVGLEVDRTAADRLLARNLLDAGEVSLQQTITQLRQVVTSMHRDAAEAVAAGDGSLVPIVQRRTADVDRLAALVGRQFTRALVDVAEVERLDTDRTTACRHDRTATSLRRIGEDAAHIAALGEQLDGSPHPGVGDELRRIATVLDTMLGAVVDGDLTSGSAARDELVARLEAIEETVEAESVDGAVVYGRLLERYRRSAAAADAIARATTQARLLADGLD